MTTPYIYKWTNKVTGKWYIGSKTKKGCKVENHEKYVCSSGVVKPLIKQHREEWESEILLVGTVDDIHYIVELEGRLLRRLNARDDPMSYNQHNNDKVFSRSGIARSPHAITKHRDQINKLVQAGTHNFLKRSDGTSIASDLVAEGNHHFQTNHPNKDGKTSKRLVAEGKHHFQTTRPGPAAAEARLENGTHHFQTNNPSMQKVTCVYCNKTVCKSAHTKYHGANCKQKDING